MLSLVSVFLSCFMFILEFCVLKTDLRSLCFCCLCNYWGAVFVIVCPAARKHGYTCLKNMWNVEKRNKHENILQ